MKYDLMLMIPFTGALPKYLDRLEFFKKYGLVNPGTKKIGLKAIVGADEVPGITSGWPSWLDVEVIKNDATHVASKMYEYFYKIRLEELDSRWYAKIDDDSVNDLDKLINNLDHYYDYSREYYVCADVWRDEHPIDVDCAIKSGFGSWFVPDRKVPIWREKEGSFISLGAMQRILQTPAAVNIMKLRAGIHDGSGDLAFAYAARAAKIYPLDCEFLNSEPRMGKYSVFGGKYNHIHYVAPDINPRNADLLMGKYRTNRIFGPWVLFDNWQSLECLHFNEDNTITPFKDDRCFWIFEDEKLLFLNENGKNSYEFNTVHADDVIEYNLIREKKNLFLRKVHARTDSGRDCETGTINRSGN